jgi:hypothetical protein
MTPAALHLVLLYSCSVSVRLATAGAGQCPTDCGICGSSRTCCFRLLGGLRTSSRSNLTVKPPWVSRNNDALARRDATATNQTTPSRSKRVIPWRGRISSRHYSVVGTVGTQTDIQAWQPPKNLDRAAVSSLIFVARGPRVGRCESRVNSIEFLSNLLTHLSFPSRAARLPSIRPQS